MLRVEARSADLLAVGMVRGDAITVHLSGILDNAPVRDASVTIVLRGISHPTVAEADGGYSLRTPDLARPGVAAIQMQVARGAATEVLDGQLTVPESAHKPADQNSARQLGWWILNFAVCIGFLMLWRRRKGAEPEQ